MGIIQRSIMMTMLMLLATPACAFPCLWSPFSGCSFTFVSPEYAARPVQPLDPQKALEAVNPSAPRMASILSYSVRGFLARPPCNPRLRPRVVGWVTTGLTSTAKDRAARAGYHAKIASENVASGQKSFADAMHFWEESSGHRTNLLRPNVTAIAVAMAKTKSGHSYWTLVRAGE